MSGSVATLVNFSAFCQKLFGSVATLVNFSASCQNSFSSVATLVNFSASCQNLFGFNLAVVERVLRGSTKKIKMDVLIFPYDGSHAEVFELITHLDSQQNASQSGIDFFQPRPNGISFFCGHFGRKKASFPFLWASLLSFLQHKL